jgi:hypothetical protein
MPQKEACENQIPDETEVRKEWQFDYRGVSDLIRRRLKAALTSAPFPMY